MLSSCGGGFLVEGILVTSLALRAAGLSARAGHPDE
jgi:hypothetical protein